MPRRSLKQLWKDEFRNYNLAKLYRDLLAGITVAAVALPLALAFGVASGADAPSGLVTAILAGIIIGGLSGAPYQISGPTGAMSAVLIVLAERYGMTGIWVAGVLSGVFLLLIGLFKLGRFIAFIPSPVMTGFTSGIAAIIIIGQLDNFLGVHTQTAHSALLKLWHYFQGGWKVDYHAILIGLTVVLVMIVWPKKWTLKFPSSLAGLIIATLIAHLTAWPLETIGTIPTTLILDKRLSFAEIPWFELGAFVIPALSITALGAIESLLCGRVGSNMTGIRLQANQELIAQGVGNIVIPFFGGVPATAAIARTSVAIKAGGETRLVSIFHALGLLLSMFILAPLMSGIPLAALAGVLIITAWRMNEWDEIHFILKHRLKTAIISFFATMLATISFDLTQAILIGTFLSALAFISEISRLDVEITEVDHEKLLKKGVVAPQKCPHVKVAFLTGPLFFGAVGHFNEAFLHLEKVHALVISMRGVPLIDTSGILALEALHDKLTSQGSKLMLVGVHEQVLNMITRTGMLKMIGEDNIFWSSDQAIVAAGNDVCRYC